MKKPFKLLSLLLIVACASVMFAGCDLFTTNNMAYYNQTVITANYADDSKIEISRKDYLTAFNNYGQNLMSSYGYSEEKAKEATIDALINRKILLKEAKRVAQTAEGASVALTDPEVNELFYQTYSAVLSNAREYESDIRKDWNMPVADSMAEETTTSPVKYEAFEKQARPVYDAVSGTYKIQLLKEDNLPNRNKKFKNFDEVYSAILAETKNNTTDALAREEYRRYLASLQSSQKVLGTNYSEEELFIEEIKRIYNNLEENEYLTKYQEYKQDNNGYSNISVSQVLEKYKSMISASKFTYENDLETYGKDMLGNFSNVNYFVNDNYFYVAHILIKFDDAQQAIYNSLQEQSNNGQGYIISSEYYEEQKNNLYAQIKANVRDTETGEIVSTRTLSANDVLKEVQIALANASTQEQKDEAFRNLMYKYNEDDGIMNAAYPYVIGTTDSQMVESFTNASRDLHQAGAYGAVSGLVESEYGVHIIYYMGQCENPFTFAEDGTLELRADYTIDSGNGEVKTSDILKLDEIYLNNLNNKTIFDLVYEGLVSDNYSQYEKMNLDALKELYDIQIVVTNI